MADLDEIRSRLESVAEDLADAALDLLREAAALAREPGDASSPGMARATAEERRITRARRSVERAVSILSDAAGGDQPAD